jgi:hypothetical protein
METALREELILLSLMQNGGNNDFRCSHAVDHSVRIIFQNYFTGVCSSPRVPDQGKITQAACQQPDFIKYTTCCYRILSDQTILNVSDIVS